MVVGFMIEYGPIFGGIAIAALILNGFRKMMKNALPGDQEMLALLHQLRTMKMLAHRESREAVNDLFGPTFYTGRPHKLSEETPKALTTWKTSRKSCL